MSTDNLTGTLSSTGNLNGTFGTSGGGGTSNYNDLSNKPQINGNTLEGNKTPEQLGINIPNMSNYYNKSETDALLDGKANVSDLPNMNNYYNKSETDALLDGKADVSDLPNMNNYYNKSETDTLLDSKVNNSSFNAASMPITSGSTTNTKDYIDSLVKTKIVEATTTSSGAIAHGIDLSKHSILYGTSTDSSSADLNRFAFLRSSADAYMTVFQSSAGSNPPFFPLVNTAVKITIFYI